MNSPELPPRIGRYEPFEVLGAGAMGQVYLAVDPLIDRMVAIKVIRADLLEPADRAEFLERFRTEVRAAARCAHPAIVAVFDFSDEGAMPYIVMEHVPGSTMARLLRSPPDELTAMLPQLVAATLDVLEGLAAAHALGVVHRDIKPANIMITPRGAVKIADFGIARLGVSTLTVVGGMIGTPGYMAPEQALGQPVDPRADLFAVAAILFEVLHGRPPFAGPTMAETLLKLTGPEPAALGALEGTAIGAVLRRGLAKDPAARFASAADFAAALRRALAHPEAPEPVEEATRVISPAPAPPAAPPGLALSDAARQSATEALAFLVGPIARVLVQKAAAEAQSPAQFADHLCARVAPGEAPALRRKLLALF
jgi:serine/threonine-protein kinase